MPCSEQRTFDVSKKRGLIVMPRTVPVKDSGLAFSIFLREIDFIFSLCGCGREFGGVLRRTGGTAACGGSRAAAAHRSESSAQRHCERTRACSSCDFSQRLLRGSKTCGTRKSFGSTSSRNSGHSLCGKPMLVAVSRQLILW